MSGAASASSFWAQKSREVKTSTALASVVFEPVKAHVEVTEAKRRMVLKGKPPAAALIVATYHDSGIANGTPASATPKKHDWADSEDDDDFIASFSAQKNPRITALENKAAHQDARIEALESIVESKDTRIAQIEDVVEEKVQRIISLEMDAQAKDAILEKLRTDNHTQFLYVQELVGEVDEKTRRVQELEIELDNRGARIRELEMDLESQTQVSVHDGEENKLLNGAAHIATVAANDEHDASANADQTEPETTRPVSSTNASRQANMDAEDANTDSIEDAPSATLPSKEFAGPTFNNSKVPKLWSPEMVTKVAPVERPKVLKMAIDTSKFGKKPAPVVKKLEPTADKSLSFPTYGQSTKHRTKSDVVPEFQVDKDIRHMPYAERVLFANGPEVAVMLGSVKLSTLPKYILMQCSGKAHKYFTEHSDTATITFPASSMDTEAAKAHLQWMEEMTYQGRVYSLTLNADEKFDLRNLQICQAARVMGLNNTYVGHFTKIICDRVRSDKLSVDSMSLICELAYPANDPIFDCLANNLVYPLSNSTKKPEDLESLLARYPHLKEKMAKIERRVKGSRVGDNRKGGESKDGNGTRGGSRVREGEKRTSVR
jgi:uncharacterized coiled-coil protein SlyX